MRARRSKGDWRELVAGAALAMWEFRLELALVMVVVAGQQLLAGVLGDLAAQRTQASASKRDDAATSFSAPACSAVSRPRAALLGMTRTTSLPAADPASSSGPPRTAPSLSVTDHARAHSRSASRNRSRVHFVGSCCGNPAASSAAPQDPNRPGADADDGHAGCVRCHFPPGCADDGSHSVFDGGRPVSAVHARNRSTKRSRVHTAVSFGRF
jgi:hypothetical protein